MVCLEVYLLPSGSCRVFLQSRTGWTGGRSVWTEQFLPVASCFHTFPLPLQREPVSTPNKCFRSSRVCQPSFVMLPQGTDKNFISYNQLRCNFSGVKGHMKFTRLAVSSEKQIPVPHLWEEKKKKKKTHKGDKNIWRNMLYDSETETEEFVKSAGGWQRKEESFSELGIKHKVFHLSWWLFIHIASIFFFLF